MDDQWIYGSRPEQIYTDIVQGRPNGMPSFRGKIPDYQVWELVAYVRSMSGQLPSTSPPLVPTRCRSSRPSKRERTPPIRRLIRSCNARSRSNDPAAPSASVAVPGFTGTRPPSTRSAPARTYEHEFALIFWITTVVYLLVMAVLVIAVARKRHTLDGHARPCPDHAGSLTSLPPARSPEP